MRSILAQEIAKYAQKDKNFLMLSGDHGYSLFDPIIQESPSQFVNVGIMEQFLISMSAGLARIGYKTFCYGLASFVPIRVLEQLKFDVCIPNLPVKIIGDGAGLVYSTLGNSHFCAEDIACVRSLQNIEIYSPGDKFEMQICLKDFYQNNCPAYLRVGKADLGNLNDKPLSSTKPYFVSKRASKICFITTGPLLITVNKLAKKFNVSHLSIMKLKQLDTSLLQLISSFSNLFIFEEHVRTGGLSSAISEFIIDNQEKMQKMPNIKSFALNDTYPEVCGSYSFLMKQNKLDEESLEIEIMSALDHN